MRHCNCRAEMLQWFRNDAMQLHLETDELNLLANILLQKAGRPYDALLEMVLARNLRFDCDDLETVSDLLAAERGSLKGRISSEAEGVRKGRMLETLALLERLQEKVNEACVMI